MQNQTTRHNEKQEERQVGRQTGRQEGRQAGRQARRQGIQNLGKADTPSNTGTHVGRQWETRGDKTSGRRTHHPTQARMWGDSGRQWQTREKPQKKQTYHHRHTCGETTGDKKGPQDVEKADAPSNTGTRVWRQLETMGDNWFNGRRQDLGKADTPSNTGRQGETRPREGEHTIQNMQAYMWGDNGRQA